MRIDDEAEIGKGRKMFRAESSRFSSVVEAAEELNEQTVSCAINFTGNYSASEYR